MAIGCDQGGSIRIPSAWCGAYGLKPTYGLVPYTGVFPIELTLDHTGPIAATTADVALLLEAIAGEDGLDPPRLRHTPTHSPTIPKGYAAAGFVTLVFDYRYQGASEGEPRGRIIPAEQHEDYSIAITWTSLRPGVDASRIGVWGSSYSGAHVLHLAAFDKRIKAAVSQVLLVNGMQNAQRLLRADVLAQFIETLAQDRVQRYTQGAVNYVFVVASEGQPCALPTPDSYEWFTKTAETRAPG